jgi:hypothetical protein
MDCTKCPSLPVNQIMKSLEKSIDDSFSSENVFLPVVDDLSEVMIYISFKRQGNF